VRLTRKRLVARRRTSTRTALVPQTSLRRAALNRQPGRLPPRPGVPPRRENLRQAQQDRGRKQQQARQQAQQHRAKTQLRVTLTAVCGRCHGCQGPDIPAKGPSGPPQLPVLGPRPTPVPLQPRQPGFVPVVRLGPVPPALPLLRPAPAVPGLPRTRPALTALPAMRPPQLPPLALTTPPGRAPLPGLLLAKQRPSREDTPTTSPGSDPAPPPVAGKPGEKPSALEPPQLPPLEGVALRLPAEGKEDERPARAGTASRPALLPGDVLKEPELPPLASTSGRNLALLPALDKQAPADEPESVAKPSSLELVLRPPPLPPLPASALR
jgi:hypothetical protein